MCIQYMYMYAIFFFNIYQLCVSFSLELDALGDDFLTEDDSYLDNLEGPEPPSGLPVDSTVKSKVSNHPLTVLHAHMLVTVPSSLYRMEWYWTNSDYLK